MAGHAPSRPEQSPTVLRRHRVRRLQREPVLAQRHQEVGDRPGRLAAFVRRQHPQHLRHGAARGGRLRIGDEPLQMGWVHPRTDCRQPGRLFRMRLQRPLCRMAGHAVEFLDQHPPSEFRIDRRRGQPRDDGLGPDPEHQPPSHEQCRQASPGRAPSHLEHSGRHLGSHYRNSERTPTRSHQQITEGVGPHY